MSNKPVFEVTERDDLMMRQAKLLREDGTTVMFTDAEFKAIMKVADMLHGDRLMQAAQSISTLKQEVRDLRLEASEAACQKSWSEDRTQWGL